MTTDDLLIETIARLMVTKRWGDSAWETGLYGSQDPEGWREAWRKEARDIIAAIAATGRLLNAGVVVVATTEAAAGFTERMPEPGAILPLVVPPAPDNPGETWTEWGYRVNHPGGEVVDHYCDEEGCWHEEDARLYMRMHLDDHPDTTAVLIRRTAWYATTAWEVAP